MNEAVTLNFIFQTIGVILIVTAICVILVNMKTKKIKNKKLKD
jgi:hypothetical protein